MKLIRITLRKKMILIFNLKLIVEDNSILIFINIKYFIIN